MAENPYDVPVLRPFAVIAALVILAHILDPWAFRHIRVENIYGEDWGRFLRVLGFFPLWIAVGVALIVERGERGWRRIVRGPGGLVILGAGLGGLSAELLKIIFRRLRPGDLGEYVFRPWSERTFSSGGLGLPSSHAMVAFGAAAIMSRIFPRTWWLWWGLAWGCGLSRVAAGAHFLSDVAVAAAASWLVGAWVWRWRAGDDVA